MANTIAAQKFFEKGLEALNQSQFKEAEYNFRQSLRYCPQRTSTTVNLAVALLHQNYLVESMLLLESLRSIAPNNPDLHRVLGVTQARAGKILEAVVSFETALELEPNNILVLNNLGVLWLDAGRYETAKEFFEKAIAQNAEYVDAYIGLGQVNRVVGNYSRAINNLKQALNLRPNHAEANMSIGNVYYNLGRCDKAYQYYKKAYSINPDLPYLLGSLLHVKARMCLWHGEPNLELLKSRIKGGALHLVPPFAALSMTDDPALLDLVTHSFAEKNYPVRDQLGSCTPRSNNPVIHVAYYSSDFRNHAVGHLICRILELHSRKKLRIYAFAIGPNAPDEVTQRIKKAVDCFVDARNMSDVEIAQLSRTMEIDIAVDLNGFTEKSRTGIFSFRCAPVQVNYLGYPYTTGLSFYDYILADKTVIPDDARRYYSEQVVWLPGCYQANDPTKAIAKEFMCRKDFGLPSDGFVFCSFNNSHKILDETFRIWMDILRAVPGSVLWLLLDNDQAVTNLRKAAEALGVSAHRIIFAERLPLDRHLARHSLADLFLDTLPYNAHTTASDALWAGLPVLTCIGKLFPGRVAASILQAMSLNDLIVSDMVEYAATAIFLARNPEPLMVLRNKIATTKTNCSVFDANRLATNLETAYEKMQQLAVNGMPAIGFEVASKA